MVGEASSTVGGEETDHFSAPGAARDGFQEGSHFVGSLEFSRLRENRLDSPRNLVEDWACFFRAP